MKVRAIKQGVLNNRIVAVGEEFDISVAPAEWFHPTGWLELVDPLARAPRTSSQPIRNAYPPKTMADYQRGLDGVPPRGADLIRRFGGSSV